MVMIQTYLSWQISYLFKKPPCRSDCILNISRMITEFNPAPVPLKAEWTSTRLTQKVGKRAQADREKQEQSEATLIRNVLQSPAYTHIAEKCMTRVLLMRTEQSDRVDAWDTSVPAPAQLPNTFQHKELPPAFGYSLLSQCVVLPFIMEKKNMHCRRNIYISLYIPVEG